VANLFSFLWNGFQFEKIAGSNRIQLLKYYGSSLFALCVWTRFQIIFLLLQISFMEICILSLIFLNISVLSQIFQYKKAFKLTPAVNR
jgi:hypothetical protein